MKQKGESQIALLEAFGLTDIEARIYLFLLGKTPQTVLSIARGLGYPRTSVYDNVQKLIEKGLLERVLRYKSQLLRAYPLEILETVIDREKKRVEELKDSITQLKETINAIPTPTTTTQVRYYHGAVGFRQMMWNALSAKDEHVGYSELGRVEIVGKKFLDRWFEEMIRRNIKDCVIVNPKKETLKALTRRSEAEKRRIYQKTRCISQKQLDIIGDTTIYNNTFAIAWWKQGEVVGVEIENPELVKTQRSIFEILWRQAKPLIKT